MDPRTLLISGLAVWIALSSQECSAAVYRGRCYSQGEGSGSSPPQGPDAGHQETIEPDQNQQTKDLQEVVHNTGNAGTLDTIDEVTTARSLANAAEKIPKQSDVADIPKEHVASESKRDLEPDSLTSTDQSAEEGHEEEDENGTIRGKYSYIEEDGIPAKIEYEAVPGLRFVIKNYIKGSKILPVPELGENLEIERAQTEGNSYENPVGNKINSGADSIPYAPKLSVESSDGTSTAVMGKDPEYEHASVIARYESKKLTRKTRTVNDQDNKSAMPDKPEMKTEQIENDNTEEDSREPPADASYRFGFSADGQTRNEESDAQGNVQGSYSYIGGDGLLTKVKYEAGSGKGFIVKSIEQEDTGRSLGETSRSRDSIILDKSLKKLNSKVEGISQISSDQKVKSEDHKIQSTSKKAPTVVNVKPNYGEEETGNGRKINMNNDGSYSFSYATPDQWREESVDSTGLIKGRYSFIAQRGSQIKQPLYKVDATKGFISKDTDHPFNHIPQAPKSTDIPALTNLITQKVQMNNDGSYSFSYVTPHQYRAEVAHVKEHDSIIPKDEGLQKQDNHETTGGQDLSASSDTAAIHNAPSIENDGSYSYSYETSDQMKQEAGDVDGNVHGQYSYMADDGIRRTVNYKASSESGFTAEGSHLPLTENVNVKTGSSNHVETNPSIQEAGGQDLPASSDTAAIHNAPSIENDGSYSYSYETSDQMKQEAGDVDGNVHGQYSYMADDGIRRTVNYKASSESGFTAEGSHLPSTENVNVKTGSSNQVETNPSIQEVGGQDNLASSDTAATQNAPSIKNGGSYSYSYETSDQMKQEAGDVDGNVHGQYSYIADDGIRRTVHYKASPESGFTVEGSHLPSTENVNVKTDSSNLVKTKASVAPSHIPTLTNLGNPIVYSTSINQEPSTFKVISAVSGVRNWQNMDPSYSKVNYEGFNSSPRAEVASMGDSNKTPTVDFIPQGPEGIPQVFLDLSGIRRAVATKDNGRIYQLNEISKKGPVESTPPNFENTLPDGSYSFAYNTKDQLRRESVDTKGNVYSSYQYKTKDDGRTVVVVIRKSVKDAANDGIRTARTISGKQTKRNALLEHVNYDRNYMHDYHPSGRRTWFNRKRHVQGLPDPNNDYADQRTQYVQAEQQYSQVNSDELSPSEGSNGFENKLTLSSTNENTGSQNYRRAKSIAKPFRGNVKYQRQ